MSLSGLLGNFFSEMNIKILGEERPVYKCDCSYDRIKEALASLGPAELRDMIQKDKGAEITCRFCNKKYNFNEQELELIMEKLMESKDV